MSSVSANEGMKGQIAYSAAKAAINGIVLPMARDLGKYGIRALSIAPGPFTTPLNSMAKKEFVDEFCKQIPLGRYGFVDEFSHMVRTCVENSYLNGVVLNINGGLKLPNMWMLLILVNLLI